MASQVITILNAVFCEYVNRVFNNDKSVTEVAQTINKDWQDVTVRTEKRSIYIESDNDNIVITVYDAENCEMLKDLERHYYDCSYLFDCNKIIRHIDNLINTL